MKQESNEKQSWFLLSFFFAVGMLSSGAEAMASFLVGFFSFVDMLGIRWMWQYIYYYTFVWLLRFGWCSWGIDKDLHGFLGSAMGVDAATYATWADTDEQIEICKTGFDLMWEEMWYDSDMIKYTKFNSDFSLYDYTVV